MNAHRIRLRAPWQSERHAHGGVSWNRRFHRPTNVDPAERAWIVVSGVGLEGTAGLNGQVLGPLLVSGETRFDVTGLLADRNELAILFAGNWEYPGDPDRPTEVWLEIG